MAGRPFPKIEIILKKFGNPKIISTFAIPIAEIAQLVEHDLAKVGVASSSLVFALTFRTILELAAPNHPPSEGRGGYERARCHVADVGSSLVFRSTFSLTPVGLFSYLRFQSAIHFVFIV